jgi:poly-gamma-glutamate synthesis protein (capsule biosynthesis protein)
MTHHFLRCLGRLAAAATAAALALSAAPTPAQSQSGGTRVYALAAPFPSVPDSVRFEDLKAFWHGDPAALQGFAGGAPATLVMSPDTAAAMTAVLGQPAAEAGIVLAEPGDLVAVAWAARPGALAILPFDQLEARWKLVWVDGMNLFDRDLDIGAYPLKAGDGPVANRDPGKLAVVAMTGVTALVRGTAVQMERKGITYPGEKIRDWLASADVAHISNEVSFWDECRRPTFNDGVSMCSNPKYIELLQYVGTDLIELSGNHLWDKGWKHLLTTIDLYDQLGWPHFAGGRDLEDALKPVKMIVRGNRVAFVGCNWFGADWAKEGVPGSAPCGTKDPRALDWITGAIRALREEGFLVIATLQYQEYYTYKATAQQQRDFKALRDAGAVVVNGSQGHHAQGFDVSSQGFIHYGTGNLFFGDQAGAGTHQTFVDRHVFHDGRYLGVELRTAYIQDYSQPVPMSARDRAALLSVLFAASGY